MIGAIYAADMWCAGCADKIKDRLCSEGNAPADIDDARSYDSDVYPKDVDVSCESDTVQHCAAGADCVDAHEFDDDFKIGVWLENDLTSDGEDCVRDAVRAGREAVGGNVVTELWAEYYGYLDFNA